MIARIIARSVTAGNEEYCLLFAYCLTVRCELLTINY